MLGAGRATQEGFLTTDKDTLNMLDRSSFKRHCKAGEVEIFLAEHVFEHLTYEDGIIAAANCRKFLKRGGRLRIAVPDGFHKSERYINRVKPGGYGMKSWDHKILFTHLTLSKLLRKAGFLAVELLEWWDESHKFHHKDWDPALGIIHRSLNFRSNNPEWYSSLIVDAIKI